MAKTFTTVEEIKHFLDLDEDLFGRLEQTVCRVLRDHLIKSLIGQSADAWYKTHLFPSVKAINQNRFDSLRGSIGGDNMPEITACIKTLATLKKNNQMRQVKGPEQVSKSKRGRREDTLSLTDTERSDDKDSSEQTPRKRRAYIPSIVAVSEQDKIDRTSFTDCDDITLLILETYVLDQNDLPIKVSQTLLRSILNAGPEKVPKGATVETDQSLLLK